MGRRRWQAAASASDVSPGRRKTVWTGLGPAAPAVDPHRRGEGPGKRWTCLKHVKVLSDVAAVGVVVAFAGRGEKDYRPT